MSLSLPLKHFMVDLETLGLTPDSVVLSIGATEFGWADTNNPERRFYAELDVNKQPTRKIDPKTLAWWSMQPNMPTGHILAETAIRLFHDYLVSRSENQSIVLWSRGTDFDIPLLYSLYAEAGIDPPWKYYNVRDLRTLDKLLPGFAPTRMTAKHNAVEDAVYQAHHAAAILRHLKVPYPGVSDGR